MNPITLLKAIAAINTIIPTLTKMDIKTVKTVRNLKKLSDNDYVVLYDIHFNTEEEAKAFMQLEDIIEQIKQDL